MTEVPHCLPYHVIFPTPNLPLYLRLLMSSILFGSMEEIGVGRIIAQHYEIIFYFIFSQENEHVDKRNTHLTTGLKWIPKVLREIQKIKYLLNHSIYLSILFFSKLPLCTLWQRKKKYYLLKQNYLYSFQRFSKFGCIQ